MAGIGFELKKLFSQKSLTNFLRAYGYASVVTLGSFFLVAALILSIQLIMKNQDAMYHSRQLFVASVAYAFVFSLIVSGGFVMIITRFIADRLYAKEYEDIVPSLFGIISLVLAVGAVPAIAFFWYSPLPLVYKFVTYALYSELLVLRLIEVYVSALHDYKKITLSYFIGTIAALALAFVVSRYFPGQIVPGCLFAVDIGVLIIIGGLMNAIKNFFPQSKGRYYLFLTYFKEYRLLFFCGLFYNAGLYIHNIIIWQSAWGVPVAGTYIFAPVYDVVMFYAFLSILPTVTLFIVFTEISFYEKARSYFAYITRGGSLNQITMSRKEMQNVLWQELSRLAELQFIFTLLFFVLGGYLLTWSGMDFKTLELYNIMLFSAFCTGIFLIVTIFMLYFDDRKGTFVVISLFFLLSASLTWVTLQIGESFYGFGFFAASLLSLIFALTRLSYFLKHIDFYVFCSQPVFVIKKYGIASRWLLRYYNKSMSAGDGDE